MLSGPIWLKMNHFVKVHLSCMTRWLVILPNISIGKFLGLRVNSLELSIKVDFVDYAENQIHGKCFSIPMLENTVITKVKIQSNLGHADVIFTSPGNWYTDEFKYWHYDHDTNAEVDINNELFEVLDFDGEECSRYGVDQQEDTRDTCVKKYIEDQLWSKIGCFTPFHSVLKLDFLFRNSNCAKTL